MKIVECSIQYIVHACISNYVSTYLGYVFVNWSPFIIIIIYMNNRSLFISYFYASSLLREFRKFSLYWYFDFMYWYVCLCYFEQNLQEYSQRL